MLVLVVASHPLTAQTPARLVADLAPERTRPPFPVRTRGRGR